jgi:hypothetical protein
MALLAPAPDTIETRNTLGRGRAESNLCHHGVKRRERQDDRTSQEIALVRQGFAQMAPHAEQVGFAIYHGSSRSTRR